MPVLLPQLHTEFPPSHFADETGLLAIGGNLSQETLLTAYKRGIFPWYNEDEPICWYTPDPRFVLFPDNMYVSKSMKQVLKRKEFLFRRNADFASVISYCRQTARPNQEGTWITSTVSDAYNKMFENGFAESAEAWQNGTLVGGLYGVKIGNVFFGESMFALTPNASKFAFIKLVEHLREENVKLIDCQVYTAHLESLGAHFIAREEFENELKALIG